MTLSARSPDPLQFIARAAQSYAKLIASGDDPETGLGGRLFYAGELDEEARALVVAANIAGAATLAASADRAVQKQALREGVADFLVSTLDEALRILKNQLRKRETVAVSVAIEPCVMEREMDERGVAPDLVRSHATIAANGEAAIFEGCEGDETGPDSTQALVAWRAGSARHNDLAQLDEVALSCLQARDWAARRWVRHAPRYLGRLAQGEHVLLADRAFAARFAGQLSTRVDRGEISFSYEIRSYLCGVGEKHSAAPEKT